MSSSGEPEESVSAEILLAGTPYLIEDGSFGQAKFERISERAREVRVLAERVGRMINAQAGEVFESFGLLLRTELVAESNKMEHIPWSSDDVRQTVLDNRDLLALPAHAFVESVRADNRTYEALGLYRAQLLADEWAGEQQRPLEIEIRQLHSLIVGAAHYAGRYKQAANAIGGAVHRPPEPIQAAEGMRQLTSWWQAGSGVPTLDATVVHAWLAHLHPFEDGNGRLARLLANLTLSQAGYPPLIIEAETDRGEYYDSLAASDEGDLLPLYDLFTKLLRRTVRRMGRPDYIEGVIRDRMLTTPSQQQKLWQVLAESLTEAVRRGLRTRGWYAHVQGYPSASSFQALAELQSEGNGWYLKVEDERHDPRWLMWFGFNSWNFRDIYGDPSGYPSIFLSVRDEDPRSIHPYKPLAATEDDSIWTELVLVPGRAAPARLLQGHRWDEMTVSVAAERMAGLLVRPVS